MVVEVTSPFARALVSAQSVRRRQRLGSVLRILAPVLPNRRAPREPIFVVGAPRSGTTMLYDVLNQSPDLRSVGPESQVIWDIFHPQTNAFAPSQALGPEDLSERERRVVTWCIHAVADGHRYLDKLPRNACGSPS